MLDTTAPDSDLMASRLIIHQLSHTRLGDFTGLAYPVISADGSSSGEGQSALDLDLRDEAGVPHYRASVAVGSLPAPGPWAPPAGLVPQDCPHDGSTLFHGPRFRAIRAQPGVCSAGAECTVAGVHALGWDEATWQVDPAALDGGLQLAVLWAQQAGAGSTLPMAIRECRVYRYGAVEDEVRCVVLARQADDSTAVCDVALIDSDGSPRVELLGVQLVRRPPLWLAVQGGPPTGGDDVEQELIAIVGRGCVWVAAGVKPSATPTLVRIQDLLPPAETAPTSGWISANAVLRLSERRAVPHPLLVDGRDRPGLAEEARQGDEDRVGPRHGGLICECVRVFGPPEQPGRAAKADTKRTQHALVSFGRVNCRSWAGTDHVAADARMCRTGRISRWRFDGRTPMGGPVDRHLNVFLPHERPPHHED